MQRITIEYLERLTTQKKDGRDYYWWDFRTGNWYKDLDISDKDLMALN